MRHRGLVTFDDVGWDTVAVISGEVQAGVSWSYTFIADTNGFFTLIWDIDSDPTTTNLLDLNPFNFEWSGAGAGAVMGVDTTSSVVRAIVAGTPVHRGY